MASVWRCWATRSPQALANAKCITCIAGLTRSPMQRCPTATGISSPSWCNWALNVRDSPWDAAAIERRFAMMDAYYLGDGWYSDGPRSAERLLHPDGVPFFTAPVYATLKGDDDPVRAGIIRERARLFAQDFISMSAAGGECVPYGRSLTYRFAMVAFWSAVAFSGLDVFRLAW